MESRKNVGGKGSEKKTTADLTALKTKKKINTMTILKTEYLSKRCLDWKKIIVHWVRTCFIMCVIFIRPKWLFLQKSVVKNR